MCPYANFPHPNVLPSMPSRKKSTRSTAHSPTASSSSADKINGDGRASANGQVLPATETLEGGGGGGTNSNGNGAVPSGANSESQPTTTSTAEAIAAAAAKMLEDSTTQTEIKLFPGILSRKGHD
jgi:hypothetical protein